MRAGSLDTRVTIENKTVTRDEFGAEVIIWDTFAVAWAEVKDVNSVERFDQAIRTLTRMTMIKMRYVAGVTSDMRIRINADGRLLAITSMSQIGRRYGWQFACEDYSV